MSIAENIKKIRLEHGLSQAELGKIAGVSDKAVSTWELGIKVPRMGAVEKWQIILALLKVPLWTITLRLQSHVLSLRDFSRIPKWTGYLW